MPLTETGFKRRTFAEILEDKIAKCKELFGDDINTDENTPLGKFIRINAYDQSLTEEEAENIYYSIFPNTARGTSLDRLCVFAGIARNAATKSRFEVKVTGTADSVVPKGFLVSTDSDVEFENIEEATIGSDGTVTITVDCTSDGDVGNVDYAAITRIVNPESGIDDVVGTALITKGKEAESDYELRQRFEEAKEGLGACNEASLKSSLLRIQGVTSASVISNDTNETVDSRPAHSFECYVSCGTDDETANKIAMAIYEKKPVGVSTYGNKSVVITDNGGQSHTIKFSYTTNVDVQVSFTVSTDSRFEGEAGKQEIKKNLENYIDGLGVGKSVYLSSLYGQIHSVVGVTSVTDLKINGSASDIIADSYEKCRCTKVTINGSEVV